MYQKDKIYRVTVRLNETQYNFVKTSAEKVDVTPSTFLRMLINGIICNLPEVKPTNEKRSDDLEDFKAD